MDRFAHHKGIAKRQRLLEKVALLRAARAESALHAVGMRSFRMSAELTALESLRLCHP